MSILIRSNNFQGENNTPFYRPRRNRKNAAIRNLIQETWLTPYDFVWPVFIVEGENIKRPIASMPGNFRWSLDLLAPEIERLHNKGLQAVAIFPVISQQQKDPIATEAINPEGLIPTAVRRLKTLFPELLIVTDIALDPFSSEGHDGLVEKEEILNDPTLPILAQMALVHAQSGADLVAPSDMMDGRVHAIRSLLDRNHFYNVGILAYTAKYASSFYGPFREALDSAPRFGDKKTYQMNPANKLEALRELELDIVEGADIVMVKPALSYLDIINNIKSTATVPVAAYQVSGEVALIEAAAQMGWIDRKQVILESLLSIKRAGADIIFSYYSHEILDWIS